MAEHMTLSLARALMDEIVALAKAKKSKPLTVCVVDAGGALISMDRQDGCGIARPQLSHAKAASCVELNMPTRTLSKLFTDDPRMHAEIKSITGRDLAPLLGGVLVKNKDNRIIGAVGVSGGNLQDEEDFAITAIKMCGLKSDPHASAVAD